MLFIWHLRANAFQCSYKLMVVSVKLIGNHNFSIVVCHLFNFSKQRTEYLYWFAIRYLAFYLFIFSEQRIEFIYCFSMNYLAFIWEQTTSCSVSTNIYSNLQSVFLVIISKIAVRVKSCETRFQKYFIEKGTVFPLISAHAAY